MLIKKSKVNFNKSGSGSYSGRITIPIDILKMLNVTKEDNNIKLSFDGEKIIITKL